MILNKVVTRKTTRPKTTAPDESKALQKALALLTRRDHSEAELSKKLSRYGFFSETIKEVLNKCRNYGYLDDFRLARQRARALMTQGRAVGPKLREDLRRRGIPEETACRAIEETCEEVNEDELLAAVFEKRFAGFDFQQARAKEKRRIVNFLLRRGFSLSAVLEFLREKGQEHHHDDGQ
jgi:regulatory protein